MPAWDRVNEVNTPRAYSGIIAETLALNSRITIVAAPARARMPLENTRRWPRLVSWRGMNESPAWKLANRGKSANDVFAARTRISVVETWSTRNSAWPNAPLPYTAWAIWARTDLLSSATGRTCSRYARNDTARKLAPRMLAIHP